MSEAMNVAPGNTGLVMLRDGLYVAVQVPTGLATGDVLAAYVKAMHCALETGDPTVVKRG